MKKPTVTFETALRSLAATAAPTPRLLRGLTSLDGDQLAELQTAWPLLNANRRSMIADQLREMAENDIELDFNAIFHFTLSDVEESVRLASVEGLWEDETPGLIDPLVILLRSDPSPIVRAACATSLGRFMVLAELEKLTRQRRDQVYSALMGAIITNPPGSLIYNRALESLSYVSNEQIEQLIREAYASSDQGLRVAAVTSMGRSGDHDYTELVLRQLNNVLPPMRVEAARACGELEVNEAVVDLGKLLDDPEPDVIYAAIEALGQIGGDAARDILNRAVHSDDEEIAEAAEEALDELDFLHGDIKFATSWFDDLAAQTNVGDDAFGDGHQHGA
ncbi:MAG: HEAT repeat domain-containing protein [Chloroflexi bacterium]|nr:HEAT repeat domain-containing protein [Chloroflexota bacterium]MCL5275812.1 HEAT repeat domain-containing protein [Chloroflexota bacterium]